MFEKILAYVTGIVFVVTLIIIVFVVDPLNDHQFFVVKLIAAMAAAGFASILPGFFNIEMALTANLVVRSGGALGIFFLVWFIKPADINVIFGPEIETVGFLGDLRGHVNATVSTDDFKLVFKSGDDKLLRDFWIETVTGDTYGEVFEKICATYPCLSCEPKPDAETSQVIVAINKDVVDKNSPLVSTSDSTELVRKKMICPPSL